MRRSRTLTVVLAAVLTFGPVVVIGGEPPAGRRPPDWVAALDGDRPPAAAEPIGWEASPGVPVTEESGGGVEVPVPAFPEPASWELDLGMVGVPAAVAESVLDDLGVASPVDLPVVVTPTGAAAPGSSLEVEVLDREVARRAGATGFVFAVADQSVGSGRRGPRGRNGATPAAQPSPLPVQFSVDYSGFADANGGDFGARLRIVALPDCAVKDPLPQGCNTVGVPLPTKNDPQGKTLTVNVDDVMALAAGVQTPTPTDAARLPEEAAAAAATNSEPASSENRSVAVFAVTAGTDSDVGTYRATPMTSAANWNVGTATGDFTYSYPIKTPATAGGTPPSVGMSYSSGAVDGMTLASNSQGTQVGLGWSDFAGAFIERSYQPCRVQAVIEDSNELCWLTDNATIHLNGVSGPLVPVNSALTEWRVESDPNWKIERLTAEQDPSYHPVWQGQHWKVTVPDGTVYWFGFGHMPGRFTNSTLRVPVYGDQAGEPCYSPGWPKFACDQGWRWYLDRVEDPDGNVTQYLYEKEVNHYEPWKGWGDARVPYDRSAVLTEIIYGGRTGGADDGWNHQMWGARVRFGRDYRCAALVNCNEAPNKGNGGLWRDVPNELVCDGSTAADCAITAPTFFSSYRYTHVLTEVKSGNDWKPVEQHNLWHEFPAADGIVQKLQLKSIQRVGLASGGMVGNPHTEFGYWFMDNRADHEGNIALAMRHNRVNSVKTELGSRIDVVYFHPYDGSIAFLYDCYHYAPQDWSKNPKACFPQSVRAEAGYEAEGVFHKFLVAYVVDKPEAGSPSSDIRTDYAYEGSPAWGYDFGAMEYDSFKGWTQWLGFASTTVTNGASKTRVRSHRGWHGDPEICIVGGDRRLCPRSEYVDVNGVATPDIEALAGRTIEEIEYGTVSGQGNQVAQSTTYEYRTETINPGLPAPYQNATYTWADVKKITERAATAPGQFRTRRSETTYNNRHEPTSTLERGWTDQEVRCSRTTYAENASRWMFSYPATNEVVAGDCTSTQRLTYSQTYYDDGTALGGAPTAGNPTRQRVLVDGGAGTWSQTLTRFDRYGRPVEVTDPRGNKTTTTYSVPRRCNSESGLVECEIDKVQAPTRTMVTNPLGHEAVTEWYPHLRSPKIQTDANGNQTTYTYDDFGRTTDVRLPTEQGTSGNSWHFDYDIVNRVVHSQQLTSGNGSSATYEHSWVIYDGLWRERQIQTQSPASTAEQPKTLVSETTYDNRGLVTDERVAQAFNGSPGAYINGGGGHQWANQIQHVYDELGRETAQHWWRQGVVAHTSTTAYTVDTTPAGAPVATVTAAGPDGVQSRERVDGLGRTVAAEEYDGTTWVGYRYFHDLADRMTGYEDPAGAVVAHGYNNAGWRTFIWDGNRGFTAYGYDLAGNQTSATPTGGTAVHIVYDALNRPMERHSGSATGPLLAKWSYDATGEKGLLNSSSSYDDAGREWISDITGYDARGRVKGTKLTVPTGITGLNGDYSVTQTYDKADRVTSTTYPAAGGLSAETVETKYTGLGLAYSLQRQGDDFYVRGVQYDDRGRPDVMSIGPNQASGWMLKGFIYDADQRLSSVDTQTLQAGTYKSVAKHTYRYRNDGNLKETTTVLNAATKRQECYQYDPRARLTAAYTVVLSDTVTCDSGTRGSGDQPYHHRYQYSPSGNLTQRTENGTATTYVYPAPGNGAPNAPTQVGADTYQWDSQGRMKQRTVAGKTENLTWDAQGNLTKVDGPAANDDTTFVYDANGQRLLRQTPIGATLSFAGHEVTKPTSGSATAVRSYTFNGELVATRAPAGVDYMITDGTGSVEMTVPSGAAPNATRAYNPYGRVRNETGTTATDRGFLGQVEDDTTKLSYLNARYYDANTGVFLSADPLLDTRNIKSLNPYSYGLNNPTTFRDPSGLSASLQQQNAALRNENARLRSENAQLRNEIRQLRNRINDLQNVIREQKRTIAALRAHNAALRAQIQHLKSTIRALNQKIAHLNRKIRFQQLVISSLHAKLQRQAQLINKQAAIIREFRGGGSRGIQFAVSGSAGAGQEVPPAQTPRGPGAYPTFPEREKYAGDSDTWVINSSLTDILGGGESQASSRSIGGRILEGCAWVALWLVCGIEKPDPPDAGPVIPPGPPPVEGPPAPEEEEFSFWPWPIIVG